MKRKLKLFLLLILTALIFTLLNPAWHWLEELKSHPHLGTRIDMAFTWAETSVAIGALGMFVSIIAPGFSRFFLGYESKKPDEGDEVFFYVLVTLFIFSLCLIGLHQQEPPHRNTEADLKTICTLLDDNDVDVGSDVAQQKVDTICDDAPEKPEPVKSNTGRAKIR